MYVLPGQHLGCKTVAPTCNCVDLQEDLQLALGCGLDEVGQIGVGQHSRDQKHSVRAGRARLEQLICLHNKLLAQQRSAHAGRADLRQVLKAALEVLGVRQHRQARRAARLVRLRYLEQPHSQAKHVLTFIAAPF